MFGNNQEKQEKITEKPIFPVTIEGTTNILNQMKYAICKIYKGDGKYGTGFFCQICPNTNNHKTFLITCNYVVNENSINNDKKIQLTLKDGQTNIELNVDESRKTYFSKSSGVTIIEIKNTDNIKYFLELDNSIFNSAAQGFNSTSIYNISYQQNQKVSVSYGNLKGFKGITIYHNCSTDSVSPGSPLLNLNNNKVIGLHLGTNKNNINIGILINDYIKKYLSFFNDFNSNPPYKRAQTKQIPESQISNKNPPFMRSISHPIGQSNYSLVPSSSVNNSSKLAKTNIIEIKLYASKEDIKNKIYFLNKSKKFNEDNIEIYYNSEKTKKFKSYIRPEQEGLHSIKLLFKENITDCMEMFQDCKNITSIDLSNLKTENVKDMSYMFNNCSNLTTINLSSFETLNVNRMKNMFCFCTKLTQIIGLSYFNTSNVIDMHEMFFGCESLASLNLSSFDFTNAKDIRFMLFKCKSLKRLIIKAIFSDGVKKECNYKIDEIKCI